MGANQWTFAWVSIALAMVIVLLARLPRRVLALTVSSLVGAVLGVVALTTSSMQRICDFERPVKVDTCSGIVIAVHGEHRLPQFMQGHSADAWLIATGAFLGVLLADLLALGAMWAWSRFRRSRAVPAPPRGIATA
jgi:tetrahydromethanopterin S-methyltransferase subunit E